MDIGLGMSVRWSPMKRMKWHTPPLFSPPQVRWGEGRFWRCVINPVVALARRPRSLTTTVLGSAKTSDARHSVQASPSSVSGHSWPSK